MNPNAEVPFDEALKKRKKVDPNVEVWSPDEIVST